jgi:hypothetical protein
MTEGYLRKTNTTTESSSIDPIVLAISGVFSCEQTSKFGYRKFK